LWLGCETTGFAHSKLSPAALRFSRVGFASKEVCVTSESVRKLGRTVRLSNAVCHVQAWKIKMLFPQKNLLYYLEATCGQDCFLPPRCMPEKSTVIGSLLPHSAKS